MKDGNRSVYILEIIVLTGELMDNILHRMPLIEKAEIRSMINGPESFTPDSRYLLGEVPEVGYNHAAMYSRGQILHKLNHFHFKQVNR